MARSNLVTRPPRVLLLATICLVVAALYFMRDVLIPLALAILLSFLFRPVVNRVERLRIGRPASVLVVVILALSLDIATCAAWGTGYASRRRPDTVPTT